MAEQGCQAVWGKVGEGGHEGASHLCLEGTCIQTEKTTGEGADTGARLKQWEAWAVQAAARITRDRHRHRQKLICKALRQGRRSVWSSQSQDKEPIPGVSSECVCACVCVYARTHACTCTQIEGGVRKVGESRGSKAGTDLELSRMVPKEMASCSLPSTLTIPNTAPTPQSRVQA